MKRLFSVLTILCVFIFTLAIGVSAATTISSAEQFAAIANNLSGDYVIGGNFTVTAPVGTTSTPFTGTIDGAGHTITVEVSQSSRAALFTHVSDGAVIKNLTVAGVASDSDITDGYNCPAAFAGETKGDVTFTNCTSNAIVKGNKYTGGFVGYIGAGKVTFENCVNNSIVNGTDTIGGFVGYISAGTVSFNNCINNNTVTGSKYIGGFVGQISGGTVAFSDCTNNGHILGYGTTGRVGGFVGGAVVTADSGLCTFNGCINKNDVTGKQMVGGIVGRFETSSENTKAHSIKNCANYGAVSSTSTASGKGMVGGIAGIVTMGANSTLVIDNCYNQGNITSSSVGYAYVGGIAGFIRAYAAEKLTLSNCMNAGAVIATNGTDCGGIIGYGNTGSNDYSFFNCYNCGSVKTVDGTRVGAIAACHGAAAINAGKVYGTYYLDIGEAYAPVNTGSENSQTKVTTANYALAKTFSGFTTAYWKFTSSGPVLKSFVGIDGGVSIASAPVIISATSAVVTDGVATVNIKVKATTPILTTHFSVDAPYGFTLTETKAIVDNANASSTGFAIVGQKSVSIPYDVILLNMDLKDATVNASVLSLKFAVADTVEAGTYYVNVKAIETYNLAEELIETATASAEVTVKHNSSHVWEKVDGIYCIPCTDCDEYYATHSGSLPTIYVDSVNGDDTANDGLSKTKAVKTIKEAVHRLHKVGGHIKIVGEYNLSSSIKFAEDWINTVYIEGGTINIATDAVRIIQRGNLKFNGVTFVGTTSGKSDIIFEAAYHNLTMQNITAKTYARCIVCAGEYYPTADNTTASTSMIKLYGVTSGDDTVDYFYEYVVLGSWIKKDETRKVENKIIELKTVDGAEGVSTKIKTLRSMSCSVDENVTGVTTSNCNSTVNLNDNTELYQFRTGSSNVNGYNSDTTAVTDRLTSLTLSFNDNAHTIGGTIDITNAVTSTVNVSSENDGRTTPLASRIKFFMNGTVKNEVTTATVNYGNHSFENTITDCVQQGTTATNLTVTENVTEECTDGYNDSLTAWADADGTNHSRTCKVCGNVLTAKHSFTTWAPVNGDNTSHSRSCKACSYVQSRAHTLTKVITEAVAPTCTAAGKTAVMGCIHCTYTEGGETIAKTGHTEVTDKAVAATCTTAGKTAGKHCSVCGVVTVSQTEVAAIGHSMKQTASEVSATCGAAGKTAVYTCANGCGKTEGGVEIPATGEHVYTNWADNGNGTHTGTCVCCKTSTVEHSYDSKYEHQFITKSTWTDHDETQHKRICSDCGYVNYSTHNYTKNYVVTPEVNATCTTEGVTAVVMCNVCLHTDGGEPVEKTSHSFVDGECSDCGTSEFLLGDVDRDGKVALTDVILALDAMNNSRTLDNADMNGDGKITLIDVLRILKLSVK
ncbi:MAG: hypothetical protein IJA60_03930 [Clostridia bacterium]|nr:hypothetical protein [Clostridia bacterium]